MDWLNINVLYFQYFILVFARMVSMITMAPLLGSGTVPGQAKIGIGFMLSIIIFPIVARDFPPIPSDTILFFGMVVKEFMVGALFGLMGAVLFAGIQLSGQIFGMQLGFGIVNVIDPLSDLQVSILGQFEFLLAILLFIAVDGHHLLLLSIANSYYYVPMSTFHMSPPLAGEISGLLTQIFVVAFKVGFPMIAAIFIVNVAMGLIARTVPQMNIFIVGLPLNIFVGLSIMAMSMGFLFFVLRAHFDELFAEVITVFRIAGGT